MNVLNYGDESVSVAFEEVDAADGAAKGTNRTIVDKSALLYKKPRYT
jgi:4-oxalocrotonate tautomerase